MNYKPCADSLFIVTEDYLNRLYYIECEYIQELLEDWGNCVGDRKICPADNSRVFFMSWNNHIINPYDYSDFKSVITLLKNLVNGSYKINF